ncbi:hypothetical protein LTR94_036763, partial [Friedmanniomyces endolithicus]
MHVMFMQAQGDQLAHAAIADQDDMADAWACRRLGGFHLLIIILLVVAHDERKEDGVEEDGDERAGKDEVARVGGQDAKA